MADKFDPYREALVVEHETRWPEEFADLDGVDKVQIESMLHAHPEECPDLEYVRVHTGFCRVITPTAEDIERARAARA